MKQDPSITVQKRRSFSVLWILLVTALAYFCIRNERTDSDRTSRLRLGASSNHSVFNDLDSRVNDEDIGYTDHSDDDRSDDTDGQEEEDDFTERPETGDLDF
jgi:hypothetical protein